MPGPVVVVPTYDEAENVGRLVAEIRRHAPGVTVLVVDDSSPDGTADVARRAGAEVLLRAEKEGLGAAYRAGLSAALARGFDPVGTMDADFSHDPARLPAMLEALRDADAAIGSRYVPGGGIENWPAFRRGLSAAANASARAALGPLARDCTSGYRLYRADLLRRIDPAAVLSDGYSFLVEILYRARRLGARVAEVPIVFTDRRAGASKISKGEIVRAVWTLARLRVTGGAFKG